MSKLRSVHSKHGKCGVAVSQETTLKYTFTAPERELLARALDFAVKHWPWDALNAHRRASAQWLRGQRSGTGRIGILARDVRDLGSGLGYMTVHEDDPVKRQQLRELLCKLVAPLGHGRDSVDAILTTAKDRMKGGMA